MKALILMAALLLPVVARAETPPVNRVYAGSFPIAESVAVPPGYATIYVSGLVPSVTHPDAEKGTLAAYGDTEEQTESVIQNIRKALQAQGADLGDIVSMRVYLAADPATGKMDFAGMMKAYSRYFGTVEQPNKPVRAAFQVAALASPAFLVEIEVVAVKPAA
jgi:enamine deaminase RidA (YjgF/YER057c/UK114 family)